MIVTRRVECLPGEDPDVHRPENELVYEMIGPAGMCAIDEVMLHDNGLENTHDVIPDLFLCR